MYNVDGTLNQGGSITHEVTLILSHKEHKKKAVFKVCDLGKSTVIIGYTWLQQHNPEIDWKTGDIKFTKCPQECNVATKKCKQKKASAFKYKALVEEIDEVIEEEERVCEDDKDTEDEPLVMFFGLCNSSGAFQTMMNEILHDMAVVVMVYIDDILIFTKTEEGHNEIIQEVLCRLRANDLFLKPEKCFFKQ